ncbi:MAG: hypothetical protein HYU64_05950 [Armatimonadetes bacterium]|nr:hypothetical protein [Armatimonadota bacterium]
MKKGFLILAVISMILPLIFGCQRQQGQQTAAPTPSVAPSAPVLTAVFGSTAAKKSPVKALAKKNGDSELTIYLYSFDPKDNQWPDAAAYAADDFFLDVTIKAEKGKKIEPGEYKNEQISPTLHTKASNYGFLKQRGSILITSVEGGKLKGELNLDDGYTKIMGPIEIDLI